MVRSAIKSFELNCVLGKLELCVPFSIARVMEENNIPHSEFSEGVTLSARIRLDAVALKNNRYAYLKFGRFNAPATVFVNGNKAGEINGLCYSYTFSVLPFLTVGENTVSVSFGGGYDPRLVGIFEDAELIRFNNSIIDKVHVTQKHEGGAVTVGIRVDTIGSNENLQAVATLVSSAGQMYYAGLTRGKGSVTVSDPLYWWPHGYGVQNLYKLTVNLYGDSDVEDSAEMRIGLRTVETTSSLDGSALTVNGVDVLPMGAVYKCEKDISDPSAQRRAEAFVTSAAMANYNTVVLSKDSPRPTEKFYDACDSHGIMVITEAEEINDEFVSVLERCAVHPSVCLVDLLDSKDIDVVIEKINDAVPELDFSVGGVWEKYVGHPSLPHEKTLRIKVPSEEMNLFSRQIDEMAGVGMQDMLLGIAGRYPYPSNLADFAYLSRICSANKISDAIIEKRLANGSLGRAVFSELGDSEVAVSSSAMDLRVRWKALQYYSARFFAPVIVSAEEKDLLVLFSVSSQRRLDFYGSIEYRIADSKNETVYSNSEPLEFDAMTSKKLFTRDFSEYVRGHEDEYYLEYSIKEGGSVLSSGTHLFVPEKYFKFCDPDISFDISGSERRFSITLAAKSFAKDVELDFDDVDAVFSDNYFDLTSSSPIKLSLNVKGGTEAAEHLKEALRIRSVYHVKQL